MLPLVAPVQALVAPDERPGVGDIAAFLHPDGRTGVFHRVIAAHGDSLTTRGDTNLAADRPVPFDAVLGRVAGLRLGRVVVALPKHSLRSRAFARGGLAWGRYAPGLRLALHRMRALKRRAG